jgi:hypothetical protein
MKTSIRISGRRGQDFNPVHVEFEAGVLTSQPRRSVLQMLRTSGVLRSFPIRLCHGVLLKHRYPRKLIKSGDIHNC